MAVRGTREIVFGTFWDHSGRFLRGGEGRLGGGGGARWVLRAPSLTGLHEKTRLFCAKFTSRS